MTTKRYYLLNQCVCGKDLGYTEVTKEDFDNLVKLCGDQPVSHGYCPVCAARMFAEFEAAKAKEGEAK